MYVIHIQMAQSFKQVGWLYQLWRLSTKVDFCNGGSVGNPCWNKKNGVSKATCFLFKSSGTFLIYSYFVLGWEKLRENRWFCNSSSHDSDTWWREFRVSRVCYSFFVITLCELSGESELPAKSTTVHSRWESLEEKIFLGYPGGREICIDARPYLWSRSCLRVLDSFAESRGRTVGQRVELTFWHLSSVLNRNVYFSCSVKKLIQPIRTWSLPFRNGLPLL